MKVSLLFVKGMFSLMVTPTLVTLGPTAKKEGAVPWTEPGASLRVRTPPSNKLQCIQCGTVVPTPRGHPLPLVGQLSPTPLI